MKSILLSSCLGVLSLATGAAAQDAPFHASQRDVVDVPGEAYSDVWWQGTEGYLGRYFQAKFDIIDISDPDNLSIEATSLIPSPNNVTSAQDIKSGLSAVDPGTILGFVSYDQGSPDALGIYDFTTPSAPVLLTTVQPDATLFQDSHNVSYREDGWLVVSNSWSSDVAFVDLTTYNPAAPPAAINSSTYMLNNISKTGYGFVHDLTLTDDYLYLAQWDSLLVYDATDLSSGPPSFLGDVRGFSCHAVWPDEDNDYIVTSEERQGGGIRLWEMADNGSSITLTQLDSYVAPFSGTGAAYTAHNPVFYEDRVFTSFYGAGVTVHQVDRSSGTWEIVATFDTSSLTSSGYDGCWGVDPRGGYDTVLASDQDNGFFTLDFSGLEIASFGARPGTVTPFTPTNVRITIDGLGSMSVNPATVKLYTSVDGGPFTATAMTNTFSNRWEGDLPGVTCGSRIDYYFAADEFGGEAFVRPAAAPAETYTTYGAVSLTTVLQDDFSTDKGWSVVNTSVSNGGFERVVPIDSGLQPGYDDPADAGSMCYITENDPTTSMGMPIGHLGYTSLYDLDGGPTTLTSPTMDFSSGDGLISYTLWQACSNPDANDGLRVEISNGGSWVQADELVNKAGGWLRRSFRISDFVTPNATVQVRFQISDNPNDAVTEGGVDNFLAESFCSSNLAGATFWNGSGANNTCFTTSPTVLGQTWVSTVDHSWRPNSTATAIIIYGGPASGFVVGGGEILVDIFGSPKLFAGVENNSGTMNTHAYPIPGDISYVGLTGTVQGAVLGGNFKLCNAYNFTVGF